MRTDDDRSTELDAASCSGLAGRLRLAPARRDPRRAVRGRGAAAEVDPLAPRPPHFPAKAKRVIFLYMTGGVSHVDTFDPKPKLIADHGKTVTLDKWQGRAGQVQTLPQAPALGVSPRRPVRHRGQRPVPAHRPSASTTSA